MAVMATERGKWPVAKRAFSYIISGPIATAWEMAPQTAITSASVYLVAMFGMSHHILPWWIAVPMAVGFEDMAAQYPHSRTGAQRTRG